MATKSCPLGSAHPAACEKAKQVASTLFLACIAWIAFGTVASHAAPLNFTSSTPIVITSPSTTLTIATGSVADSLTVNATSVVVGLSSADGGTFTLTSPDHDLTVAKTNSEGVLTATCATDLVDTLVLSQTSGATTYTIVPAAGACTPAATSTPSPPTVAVGGSILSPSFKINDGAVVAHSSAVTLSFFTSPEVASFTITTGYGGLSHEVTSSYAPSLSLNLCAGLSSCESGTYTVAVNFLSSTGGSIASSSEAIDYLPAGTAVTPVASSTPPVATSTITGVPQNATPAELEALLAQLEAELQTLLKEAAVRGIVIQGVPATATSSSQYVFTRNLSLWDRGKGVNALQRYLVAEDKGPAAEALARHGTTETFGPLTFAALKEFQKVAGIIPASGYFGPITRGYIARHGE